MENELESKVQARLENRLKRHGWLVAKVNLCSLSGWPDLICIRNGKVVFVEVKRPGGKPRILQRWCHTLITNHGGLVCVYDGGATLPLELQDPKEKED